MSKGSTAELVQAKELFTNQACTHCEGYLSVTRAFIREDYTVMLSLLCLSCDIKYFKELVNSEEPL